MPKVSASNPARRHQPIMSVKKQLLKELKLHLVLFPVSVAVAAAGFYLLKQILNLL